MFVQYLNNIISHYAMHKNQVTSVLEIWLHKNPLRRILCNVINSEFYNKVTTLVRYAAQTAQQYRVVLRIREHT